jgi:hypothetical protein
MPTAKTIMLYTFDELEESAKETAREWYRSTSDSSDFDSTIEDFAIIGEAMGVNFDTHQVRLYGGGTRQEPNVYWSGFASQGDGACFEGTFTLTGKAGEAIRAHAGEDGELHRIADALDAIAARYPKGVSGKIHRPYGTHYSHARTMFVDAYTLDEAEEEETDMEDADAEAVQELFRDLADWLYKALGEENDYRDSDENVDESILANEYTFTETGKRED